MPLPLGSPFRYEGPAATNTLRKVKIGEEELGRGSRIAIHYMGQKEVPVRIASVYEVESQGSDAMGRMEPKVEIEFPNSLRQDFDVDSVSRAFVRVLERRFDTY